MRWDLLFDDLEARLDQEQRDEERALALEEERLRLGRLTLRDRLSGLARENGDDPTRLVRLELRGGDLIDVRPLSFGRDWMNAVVRGRGAEDLGTARGASERQCIVPLAAIAAVLPTRAQLEASVAPVAGSATRLADRIGLSFVLRDLSRRRTPVHLTTDDGRLHGTLDRVARDHLDMALHESGSARRESEVRGYRIIPLERIVLVAFD
jgi:hypothetical protein